MTHTVLSESQLESINELISDLVICKESVDFDRIIENLKKLIQFRFWALVIVRLNEDGSMADDNHFLLNYPDRFMEAYTESRFELIDFVMITNFEPTNFGPFQHWAETYENVELNKENIDSKLYHKHHQFLEFVGQWGILQDGYSIGKRSQRGTETWGSIFSIADDLSDRKEAQEIL